LSQRCSLIEDQT
jgi:hypothetical protein